jgi:hypothetical protein
MLLALILVVAIVAAGTAAILLAVRRYRTPRELRGDWWTEFEREFWTYARAGAGSGRERRRHRGERA